MENSCIFKTPIGMLKICEENNNITRLYLHKKEFDTETDFSCKSDLLYEAYKQINEYFSGKRKEFDLPLYIKGTLFQEKVWRELQNIPYGETRSYEDIAVNVGNKKAVRAVGQANGKNPIMIIIPCHRVIAKNGNISGFSCGVEIKKYLLDFEKNALGV